MMMKTKQQVLTFIMIGAAVSVSGCITDKIQDNILGGKDPDTGVRHNKQPPKVVHYDNHASFRADEKVSLFQTTEHYSANQDIPVPQLTPQEQSAVLKAFENTNHLRAEKGLKPLVYNQSLGALASVRAREISHHFHHSRPNGRSFSSGLKSPYYVGENIAAGHASADQTVLKQWRESPGHYENMLRDYDQIGIGFYHDPDSEWGYYWVQIFSHSGLKSKYYFSDPAKTPERPNMGNTLAKQIHFHSGKIDLGNAPSKPNHTAARGYKNGELTHNIYTNARGFSHGGYEAIIQDPSGSGFSYQTFGEIVNSRGVPVQQINVGQATIPQDNHQFSATYRGASLGNLNQDSHVYADVTAQVEFGTQKTMNIQFQNSKMALHDIRDQNSNESIRRAEDLDFSERLTWDTNNGFFSGGGVSARFYGPNGEEMGGQFERSVTDGIYEGVFGLHKE